MQGVSLGELLERTDSRELSEWLAFDSAYGLPDIYFLTGQLCTTIARVFGGKCRPEDFVPFFRRAPREQSATEQNAIMQAIAGAMTARAKAPK